jgi:two-component system, response regulator PdtaR
MTIGVLVVEDEFLVRMDAVDFMRAFGFTVYEAGNAHEAIALLECAATSGRSSPISTCLDPRPLAGDMPAGGAFVAKPYQLERVADDLRTLVG